jgi:CubicO group peptidase (beta-lactamase class C family)
MSSLSSPIADPAASIRGSGQMNMPLEDIGAEIRELARMASGIPATAHILARRLVEYADIIEADLKSRPRREGSNAAVIQGLPR